MNRPKRNVQQRETYSSDFTAARKAPGQFTQKKKKKTAFMAPPPLVVPPTPTRPPPRDYPPSPTGVEDFPFGFGADLHKEFEPQRQQPATAITSVNLNKKKGLTSQHTYKRVKHKRPPAEQLYTMDDLPKLTYETAGRKNPLTGSFGRGSSVLTKYRTDMNYKALRNLERQFDKKKELEVREREYLRQLRTVLGVIRRKETMGTLKVKAVNVADSATKKNQLARRWDEERDSRRLEELYYGTKELESNPLGLDGLFHIMKQKYPDDYPSLRSVGEWLSKQALNQVFRPRPRTSHDVSAFKPIRPFLGLSMDLTDYGFGGKGNKQSERDFVEVEDRGPKGKFGQRGYILVVVDNFSRFMWTEALSGKSPAVVAEGLEKILTKVRATAKEYGISQSVVDYIQTDDGSEFKGPVDSLLAAMDIRVLRTTGGAPQSNGLVERANGKLKRIISKLFIIRGQSWRTGLQPATNTYNNQYNRATQNTPVEALRLDTREEKADYRGTVKRFQVDNGTVDEGQNLKVGDPIRLRIAPPTFNKGSKQSWYSTITRVKEIHKPVNNPLGVVRYSIEDDGGKTNKLLLDKKWTRKELQLLPNSDPSSKDLNQDQFRALR
jgi:hypothetical protein